MKQPLLPRILQLTLLVFMSYACTKDSPPVAPAPPAPPVAVVPVPSPVVPPTPAEPVQYEFTLENVSTQTIVTYNDDTAKPKENYKEITLSPAQKATVKVLSENGTTPAIRPANPSSQTEVVYDPGSKTYQLDSYLNLIEINILGDVENINIFFPNPLTGVSDSLMNVKLPQILAYAKGVGEVVVVAQKQQVKGSFTMKCSVKDKEVYSKIVSAPFGKLTATTKIVNKSVSASLYEPDEWPCGTHNGNRLITGPKGGCYYINKNGNKTYVDRSECSCN